jgi:LacI family transcriptional regulator
MGATMREVAARAGVSVATVSRALAGSPLVAPEVRDRVRVAADELGYISSRLPANLRGKGVRILALVVGNVRNAYFPELIDGSVEAAHSAGFPLIFGDSNEDPERESDILEQLAAERVAGVALATAGGPTKGLRRLLDLGIPVVAVDRRLTGMPVDTVTIDGELGVYQAVQHLLELGHRRIALMSGPNRLSTIADRERGYARALEDAGVRHNPSLIAQGDLRESMARQLATELMARPDPPTAIVTSNDLSTIGTLQALRALAVRVPKDVSVIGFDDVLGAELYDPPLTVIAQPVYDIGQRAIELLARRVASPDTAYEEVVFDTRLIHRGSTARLSVPISAEEV